MRLPQAPTRRQPTHRPGRLHWGHTDRALSNGNRDGLSRVPSGFVDALFPFRRRNQSGIFVREIDTGSSTQTHGCRVLGDPVDAQLFSDVIKENIARVDDGAMQADGSMASPFPACKCMTVKAGITRAKHSLQRVQNIRLQTRRRHKHLENRSRRVVILDNAVLKRFSRIADQVSPVGDG